mmetsp:Transcript_108354/g.198424  ORF Transcript_108354/g.198424 Transcript_108354/m.198424 type:complete len:143 (-) Transcript_108354:139-567(-)
MAIFNALLTLTLLASVSFTATSVMLTRYEDGGCVNDTANIDFDGATNVKAAENCTGNYSGIAMCDGKCVNLPVGSSCLQCLQALLPASFQPRVPGLSIHKSPVCLTSVFLTEEQNGHFQCFAYTHAACISFFHSHFCDADSI